MSWFEPARPVLPDIIRNNANQRRHAPALVCGDEALTWGELAARLDRVGNAFASLGLERGDRVAILMNNSVTMLEAMLGSLCGGFVAVPLNVAVADDGIARQINDCDARAVVASAEHVARLDAMRDRLPAGIGDRYLAAPDAAPGWQDFRALVAAASAEPAVTDLREDEPCNIIYSSGTTGLPKGIVHSHGCRMAWATDMAIALRYDSDARALLSLGLYSNITWVTLLATVYCGGTLILMPAFDVTSCLALIERYRVTHSSMVPVQFQRMLAASDFDAHDLSSIRALMCCGSPLHADLKREIVARIPGQFIELYGLTEGLVTIQAPGDAADNPTSVGRPCPGQQLAILGENDRPLPPGQAGEIVGYGKLLMSGYLNRDAASEEATWTDPRGRRWLRTGDIGRLDEDGNLYIVDRKKDMILSGGQNIFPADIEAVIAGHPQVADVAVVGVPSRRWGESPLAVVVGDGLDPEQLVAWTNERVGRQQRIAAVELVAELPRNPNGKVLKRELRERFKSTLESREAG